MSRVRLKRRDGWRRWALGLAQYWRPAPKARRGDSGAVKRIVATVSADTATATASLSVWQGHQINGDLVWSHIVTGDSRGGIGYTHDWEWFVC